MVDDKTYMQLALKLAEQTLGQTSPNPVVGAVVVNKGQIVGMGAHLKRGEAHAEVVALDMAGEKAKDATLYVTLEPCSHYGKTPPCTNKIIDSGVERVVIATFDPNENVHGKGVKCLKQAGIDVTVGILEKEARDLNRFFFHYIQTKKPYVTLKAAMSLDGKTATKTGDSQWITSEQARRDVHQLRKQHDAILVGVGTVLKDNPSLTARYPDTGHHPIRIILDTHLLTPIGRHVITDRQAETWIFVGEHVTNQEIARFERFPQVKIIRLPTEKLELKDVLSYLGKKEMTSVFVEGGSEIHGSFLQEELFNQVIMYIAPKLIGGRHAYTVFAGEGFSAMEDVTDLQLIDIEKIGSDIKIIAERKGEDHVVYRDR